MSSNSLSSTEKTVLLQTRLRVKMGTRDKLLKLAEKDVRRPSELVSYIVERYFDDKQEKLWKE